MENAKVKPWWLVVVFVVPLTTVYVWNTTTQEFGGYVYKETNENEKYLVNSSLCKIPDVGLWNHDILQYYKKTEYVPCTFKKQLTYVSNNGSTAVIRIDREAVAEYATRGVSCCMSYVERIDDKTINKTECEHFEDGAVLRRNTVVVKCRDRSNLKEIYVNAHSVALLNDGLLNSARALREKSNPPSVVLVGIDSLSRQNLHRLLPDTVKFLDSKNWISYNGYNKIDDNTFPNLMAVLTGRNFSNIEKLCNPYKPNSLDKCDYIWKDFKKFGYVTAYAEDETCLNTFNYLKPGFKNPPTDLYYYSYMEAAEEISTTTLDQMSYCSGPETSAGRIYDAAKDFILLRDVPKFGLFWTSTGSHNKLNAAGRLDKMTLKFFKDLHSTDVLENTILIFFSDHGLRFGNVLKTRTGWLEERLPFIYFWIPESFRRKFPSEYDNLKSNVDKLTSPYDFHMTIKELLVMSGMDYEVTQSAACPKCKSLFRRIDAERSCEDAGITMHWCTCLGYQEMSIYNPLVGKATDFIIGHINEAISSDPLSYSRCSHLKLGNVFSASISEKVHRNSTYLMIGFITIPETVLRATVQVEYVGKEPTFVSVGSVSRLDYYKRTTECLDSWKHKMYCYCKFNAFLDMNYFNFWFEV